MTDYDKMSVEELIGVAADYRGMAVTMDRFIIPALRRAVIREASAGTIRFDTCFEDGIAEITGGEHDGVYDLIPKVTP